MVKASTEQLPKHRKKDRDGVYKREEFWHFEYKDPNTGKWRSKTTGTVSYSEAKKKKAAFLKELEAGKYTPSNDRTKLFEAASAYIRHRKVSASLGTCRLEQERLRALKRVIGQVAGADVALKNISVEVIRRYQQLRIEEGVGPRTVNMEGQLLRSILKHHGQWKLNGIYEPLPEPVSELGRTLSPEQEVTLLESVQKSDKRSVAYHATVIESETGMRGVEVRNLQLKAIDIDKRELNLLKSKTKGGIRTISLGPEAVNSVIALVERSRSLGACDREHYLIPALVPRVKETPNGAIVRTRSYDVTLPVKGWRTAWRNSTKEAGLKGLRGHDLRHHWVTLHAENGTPQSVLEAQAGHLSKRQSDHYKILASGRHVKLLKT